MAVDEAHPVGGVAPPELLGHGDPREEVAAGAAAGDQHAQRARGRAHASPLAVLPEAAMFINMPMVAMFSTSEVPP